MNIPLDTIAPQVRAALAEDLGGGDLTAALIPAQQPARAAVVAREETVLCGRAWFDEVMHQADARIRVDWHVEEGAMLDLDTRVCTLAGPARAVLTAERTALNFLQLLSGTATAARRFVEAVRGTGATILDTRKTIPGLRAAQKYAVVCGGAVNHRQGLFDAILIKENHIMAAGSIAAAVEQAKRANTPVEVEVETPAELAQALEAGADRAMLDNFTLAEMQQAVQQASGRIELEASGNVSLETVRDIAATGVDYISIGAITKNVRAADFSMRFEGGAK